MTKLWDNTFRLYQGSDRIIEDVQYFPASTVVTKGQPFTERPTINNEMGDYWDVTRSSGRKKSKSPRDAFLANCGGSHKIRGYPAAYIDDFSTPDELNFTFGFRIRLGGDWYELFVGQGSNLVPTNWWCGSKQLADRNIYYGQYFQGRDNMRYHVDWGSWSSDPCGVNIWSIKTH